jgi:hypothetical protein
LNDGKSPDLRQPALAIDLYDNLLRTFDHRHHQPPNVEDSGRQNPPTMADLHHLAIFVFWRGQPYFPIASEVANTPVAILGALAAENGGA